MDTLRVVYRGIHSKTSGDFLSTDYVNWTVLRITWPPIHSNSIVLISASECRTDDVQRFTPSIERYVGDAPITVRNISPQEGFVDFWIYAGTSTECRRRPRCSRSPQSYGRRGRRPSKRGSLSGGRQPAAQTGEGFGQDQEETQALTISGAFVRPPFACGQAGDPPPNAWPQRLAPIRTRETGSER
jgi:hypothetical protein